MNSMVTSGAMQPQSFDQLMQYASMVSKSALVPKDFQNKPTDCMIAMQWGMELGLNPLQALQNIAVINGRPSLWGDMLPALVKSHPSYEWMRETLEKDDAGNVIAALCAGQRKNHPEPEVRRFSVADATAAGLWGKAGPWKQYPARMLQVRARAWLCRDLWPDALRGLQVAEEVQDYPAEARVVSSAAIQHETFTDSPERRELIDKLEGAARDGIDTLRDVWRSMGQDERMLVGGTEFERIKALPVEFVPALETSDVAAD